MCYEAEWRESIIQPFLASFWECISGHIVRILLPSYIHWKLMRHPGWKKTYPKCYQFCTIFFEKVWHLSSILRILFFNKTLNLLVHWVHCHFVVQQQFPSLLRKVNHFKVLCATHCYRIGQCNYVVHLNMNLYFSPSSSCDSFIRICLLCISDHISPIAIPFYRAHQPVTEASVLKRTCWWLN